MNRILDAVNATSFLTSSVRRAEFGVDYLP